MLLESKTMVESEGNVEISAGTLVSELETACNETKGLSSVGLKLASTRLIAVSSMRLWEQSSWRPRGDARGIQAHGLKESVSVGQMAGGRVGLAVLAAAEVFAMKAAYAQ